MRKNQGAWNSTKKMQAKHFIEALKQFGWPGVPGEPESESYKMLCSSLDFYDCGLVMRSDLEWLDKWRVPPFLEAEPDPAALEELKSLVLRLFGHLLKGWRCAFDTKDSNCVSWT